MFILYTCYTNAYIGITYYTIFIPYNDKLQYYFVSSNQVMEFNNNTNILGLSKENMIKSTIFYRTS